MKLKSILLNGAAVAALCGGLFGAGMAGTAFAEDAAKSGASQESPSPDPERGPGESGVLPSPDPEAAPAESGVLPAPKPIEDTPKYTG